MAYTTVDCKALLQDDPRSAALGANPQGWKRVSKRGLPHDHDAQLRVFHDGGEVWALVVETNAGLRIDGYANSAERMRTFGQATMAIALDVGPALAATTDQVSSVPVGRTIPARQGLENASVERTPAMAAALAFRDLWDVVVGLPAVHSGSSGMLGLTWRQLTQAYAKDAPGLDDRLHPLMKLASSTPASLNVLAEGLKWCFQSDAEYLATTDLQAWDAGTSLFLAQPRNWPAGMDVEYLTLPFVHLGQQGFHAISEGLFEHRNRDEASLVDGRTAMITTFRTLQALGMAFDLPMQQAFGQESDHDEQHPLHEKVPAMVPDAFPDRSATPSTRRPGRR